MNPAATRGLGKTGLKLTALGLGGSQLGNLHRPCPEPDALAAIAAAHDAGVRYFDTAAHYGGGLGEHRMGWGLRPYPRARYVLSTKIGRLLRPKPGPGLKPYVDRLPFAVRFDYGFDAALRSLDDSLQRLGLDRVDIALIHDPDSATHGPSWTRRFAEAMAGSYRALRRFRDEGIVHAIGVGTVDWRVCELAAERGDFDCFLLAGRYTLLEQPALASMLPLCLKREIGIIVGQPFNTGVLARGLRRNATYGHRPPPHAVRAKVAALERVARAHDVALAAAALQFPLAHPAVASVVVGGRSAAHLRGYARGMATPIPADFWLELKDEGLLDPEAPIPRRA
jgi:D-threo-aldose 1-dehydrogenase